MLFGAIGEIYGFDVAWRALALLEVLGVVPALLAGSALLRLFRRESTL